MHDPLDPGQYSLHQADLGTIDSADDPKLSMQKHNVHNEW
jgi:hypothetical protein